MIRGTRDLDARSVTISDRFGTQFKSRPSRQVSIVQWSIDNQSKKSPHPYEYNVQDGQDAQGYIRVDHRFDDPITNPYSSARDGNLNGAIVKKAASSPWSADAVWNDATSKLLAKIRNNDFNLPVALGELKETRRLGGQILELTKKFTGRITKRGLLTFGTHALADAWLTYSYGVKPVLSDIKAIMDMQPRDSYRLRIRAKRQMAHQDVLSEFDNQGNPVTIRRDGVVGVKYTVVVELSNPLTDMADRVNGFNPLLVGWELIPYSFVVDQFVNIGQTLDILGSSVSMSNIRFTGCVTEFRKTDQVTTCYHTKLDDPYLVETNYTQVGKLRAAHRTLVDGLPVPRRPSFEIPTGANFLLSAAALLRTNLLGHIR